MEESRLGTEHSQTANTLHILAEMYHEQEKYIQAEPLYQCALRIRTQQLGVDHPLTQQITPFSYKR